jgi:hypothetical protein
LIPDSTVKYLFPGSPNPDSLLLYGFDERCMGIGSLAGKGFDRVSNNLAIIRGSGHSEYVLTRIVESSGKCKIILDFEIFLAVTLGELSRHLEAGASFRTLRTSAPK